MHLALGKANTINIILTLIFVIIDLIDLIFIALAVYKDGNGINLL